MKQTFKQYLESKEQLREAIKNVPVTMIEYEIRKYCTICIGKTLAESNIIQLKPKQVILVKWNYQDIDNPVPEYIQVNGNILTETQEYPVFWTTDKLQKWLLRHAREGINSGHKI